MTKTLKLWTGLGITAGLVAVSVQAGAATPHQHENGKLIQLAQSGEGGEGGEGGAAAAGGDAGFLALLGYVEGHMRVGTALYSMGEVEHAKTHMKHPADEIYTELKPLLDQRGLAGFASELEAVSAAVEAGKPADEVMTLVETLFTAIHAQRPSQLTGPLAAETVKQMVRTAAEEYAIGVKEGKIDNVHEYQDAWGFVQTAQQLIASLPQAEQDSHRDALGNITAELNALDPLWPDIAGKAPVTGSADTLFAAAAKIELAALSMK
jgi:hypothetical protein